MAGERTIRIKFDGTAAGLRKAAADAVKHVDGVEKGIARKAGAFARIGAKIGLDLTDGISGAFKGMPPQVQAAAAAAAVAIGVTMSAAIGAALTAGILLAVGGGVLVAGIKAAADSPKVKAAWTRFGDRAKAAFKDFGKPFEGPLVRAAETFGGALERMAPTLKRMGESMAPVIDKLAPALASMAEKSLPGIEKAMEAGKPLWDTLAAKLPEIGEAIDSFFSSIAEGGPGANEFLADFLNWLEGMIIILGKVIGWLAKMYTVAKEAWRGIRGVFVEGVRIILDVIGTIVAGAAKAFGWIPGLGPKLKTAAADFEKFKNRANAALDKIEDKRVTVTIVSRKVEGGGISEHADIGGGGRTGGRDRRATGGHVSPNRSYLVGENGPEVLTMGRSPGYVTPNGALGGPQVLEAHIEIGGEVVRVVRTELRERDRQLKRRVGAGAGRV